MSLHPAFVVKVCGVTSVSDARWAVEQGANALGFNFYPNSPRYLTMEQAREIAVSVPPEILRVGVFVNASEEAILTIAGSIPLQVLQLHGANCAVPSESSYRIWRSLSAGSTTPNPDSRIEAYLLDTPTADFGGSGRIFDWSLAKSFPYPVILAGGLAGDNVSDAIERVRPWGVDACSRLEAGPGIKDPFQVSSFVQRARSAAREWKLDAHYEEANK